MRQLSQRESHWVLLHIFKGKIPKTGAMADILWYPYECEIICRKLRQDEDLRKKAFLW